MLGIHLGQAVPSLNLEAEHPAGVHTLGPEMLDDLARWFQQDDQRLAEVALVDRHPTLKVALLGAIDLGDATNEERLLGLGHHRHDNLLGMESLVVGHEVTQDVVAPCPKFIRLLPVHDSVDINEGVAALTADTYFLMQHEGVQFVLHRKERGATRISIGIVQAGSTNSITFQ